MLHRWHLEIIWRTREELLEIKRIIAEIKTHKCWRKCSGTFQREEKNTKIEESIRKFEDQSRSSNIKIIRVPERENRTHREEIIYEIIQGT